MMAIRLCISLCALPPHTLRLCTDCTVKAVALTIGPAHALLYVCCVAVSFLLRDSVVPRVKSFPKAIIWLFDFLRDRRLFC